MSVQHAAHDHRRYRSFKKYSLQAPNNAQTSLRDILYKLESAPSVGPGVAVADAHSWPASVRLAQARRTLQCQDYGKSSQLSGHQVRYGTVHAGVKDHTPVCSWAALDEWCGVWAAAAAC